MSKQNYNGFGVELSAADWARVLGLPYQMVWVALSCGATPETIAQTKHCEVDPEALRRLASKRQPKTEPRTARIGLRKERTRQLILELLDVSGYDVDPDEVTVVPGANYNQTVLLWGEPLGRYNHKKDWLELFESCLKLENPQVEDQRVRRNDMGLWEVDPETNGRIVAQILEAKAREY